jgi:hypothetical protein
MAANVYLMPSVGLSTKEDPQRAAYQADIAAVAEYAQTRYGGEPTHLVAVKDIPADLHATISADATCLALPDLDAVVGTRLTATRNKMEGWNIAASWVTADMPYRQVVRVTYIFFQIATRLLGMGRPNLFQAGVSLDTTFGGLPAGVRQDLKDVAASFDPPLDTSQVTGTTTVRQLYKGLADQFKGDSLVFGPVTL